MADPRLRGASGRDIFPALEGRLTRFWLLAVPLAPTGYVHCQIEATIGGSRPVLIAEFMVLVIGADLGLPKFLDRAAAALHPLQRVAGLIRLTALGAKGECLVERHWKVAIGKAAPKLAPPAPPFGCVVRAVSGCPHCGHATVNGTAPRRFRLAEVRNGEVGWIEEHTLGWRCPGCLKKGWTPREPGLVPLPTGTATWLAWCVLTLAGGEPNPAALVAPLADQGLRVRPDRLLDEIRVLARRLPDPPKLPDPLRPESGTDPVTARSWGSRRSAGGRLELAFTSRWVWLTHSADGVRARRWGVWPPGDGVPTSAQVNPADLAWTSPAGRSLRSRLRSLRAALASSEPTEAAREEECRTPALRLLSTVLSLHRRGMDPVHALAAIITALANETGVEPDDRSAEAVDPA